MSDPAEDRKRQSREFWDRMAAQWERRRELNERSTSHVNDWLVNAIDPAPGHTVLELAAGTGETGFLAATRVGESGRLISSDFSPEMVSAAERRAKDLGITNADFRVLDAEDLDLADDSVDGIVCRFGLMLFPDPRRALSEVRRVLRAGGRFACSTWGPPDRNPWMTTSGRLMIERGLMEPPAPDGGPGMFTLPDAETIAPLLGDAGFDLVRTEAMEVAWRFASADEYWAFVSELQGPVAVAISELDEAGRAEVRSALEERARAFERDGGYLLPGLAINTVAS